MYSIMEAFIWSTKAPRAPYCTTLHVVEVPRGVMSNHIALAIFARHNIESTVTTAIAGNRICACCGKLLLCTILVVNVSNLSFAN